MYISPEMYLIKEVLHPYLPFRVVCILYNHFCVLSFHSVLCFPYDYHMVKEGKGGGWGWGSMSHGDFKKCVCRMFLSHIFLHVACKIFQKPIPHFTIFEAYVTCDYNS